MDDLLVCNGVEKKYWNNVILKNISFSLGKGKFLLICGPNGAGKSTLLNLLSGLTKPDQGEITIFNKHLPESNATSCLWDSSSLHEDYSGIKNLRYFYSIAGLPLSEFENKAKNLLNYFQLRDSQHKTVRNYSKGMRRKLSLCRVLITAKDFLLIDEPADGLDNFSKKTFVEKLAELKEQGVGGIIVTHHASLYKNIADELIVLNSGKIIFHDSIENINQQSDFSNKIIIASVNNPEIANDSIKVLPGVLTTHVTKRAVHITVDEKESDLLPVLLEIQKAGVKMTKVSIKNANLDKFVSRIISKVKNKEEIYQNEF